MKNSACLAVKNFTCNPLKAITLILVLVLAGSMVQAQYGRYRIFGGGGYPMYPRERSQYPRSRPQNLAPFQPTANFSISYAYPNTDANQLYQFNGYDQGRSTNNGRINAALDFRFSRSASLGLLASYGKVSANYYSYNNLTNQPDLTGSLESVSVMLNYQQYFSNGSGGSFFTPYMRTAVGFNSWNQDYRDAIGTKMNYPTTDLPVLAYQVSIGGDFRLSPGSAFFVEAGYGKYILNAGLTFKNPLGGLRNQNNAQERGNNHNRNYNSHNY